MATRRNRRSNHRRKNKMRKSRKYRKVSMKVGGEFSTNQKVIYKSYIYNITNKNTDGTYTITMDDKLYEKIKNDINKINRDNLASYNEVVRTEGNYYSSTYPSFTKLSDIPIPDQNVNNVNETELKIAPELNRKVIQKNI